jgi:hypothetical protein
MKSCHGVGFEPGRGDEANTKDRPSPTPLDREHQDHADLRMQFLLSCAIRFELVERGEMALDEALYDDFIERFRAVAEITCRCEREILNAFQREDRKMREQGLRDWRWRCCS